MHSRLVSAVVQLVSIGAVTMYPYGALATHGDEITPSVVPFRIESSKGSPRPIVTARFNGHPIPMMIHSNAGFFAQLKHGEAAEFGVTLIGEHKAYGIDRAGHVSDLGYDHGSALSLSIGNSTNRNVSVSVFEIPQDNLGMLGVEWIRENRVVLDYVTREAIIAPTAADVANRAHVLTKTGYVALPMQYDVGEQRYFVKTTINGVARRMVVASASEFLIDSAYARAAQIRSRPTADFGGGPTGTHVARSDLATPLRVKIGTWLSPPIDQGGIEDTYGYIDHNGRPILRLLMADF